MKTKEDVLDEMEDDSFFFSETLIEYVDEELTEGTLKALCQAVRYNKTDRDILVFAKSLAQAINEAADKRAINNLTNYHRSPLFETFDEIMVGFSNLGIRKDAA